MFHLNSWKYPLPDNYETIDYDWDTLRFQWSLWEDVVSTLSKNLSTIPTDPLSDTEYIFSVANNKNEFEILSLLELSVALNLIWYTNAAWVLDRIPKIQWHYNWVFIKTSRYIVPVPSIVTAEEISNWNWLTIDSTNIKSQIVN